MSLKLITTISLCFLIVAVVSAVAKVPKEFQLCKRRSPDFKKCIIPAVEKSIKSINGGIKELGIPVLDPMVMPSFSINANAGAVGLTQYYDNCVLTGMSNAKYSDAVFSFDKDNYFIRFKTAASVTIAGNYKANGKLLLFQINGQGRCNITIVNMIAWHNASCAFYEKGGLEFMNITDWVEDYYPERVLFEFDNFIDGNAELTAEVLKVMNDNHIKVFQIFQHDFEKTFANIYMQITINLFSRIPWRELFLD